MDDDIPAQQQERGTRVVHLLLIVLALGVLAATAMVPRTVASGVTADETWRVQVTPGLRCPSVRVHSPYEAGAQTTQVCPADGGLAATTVHRLDTIPPVTVIVGPTPAGADSIRVTSDVGGVAEAEIRRVAWRRMHVRVLDGEARVSELVAIDDRGRVLEAGQPLQP